MESFERKFFLKLLLLTIWFSFFLSINLNPIEFLDYNIIKKIRLILPTFLLILLLSLRYKEIKFSKFLNIYSFLFYFIFFLYLFFTFSFPENNIINIFWPFYMFLSFFVLHVFTNADEKLILIKFTILIVALGFCLYFSLGLLEMIKSPKVHFYGIMGSSLNYYGLENPPRSSGLARLALILFSFIFYYYLVNQKKKNYIFLILLCFLGTISLIFQSRTVSFIYFFLIIFNLIFYFKKFFYDKRLIFFVLVFPMILNFFYNFYLLNFDSIKDQNISISSSVDQNISISSSVDKNIALSALRNVVLRDKINNFSSGRYDNWNKAYNLIKENHFNGFGAQADRLLLNQSIHNSILYGTLAGGLFGGMSIILIYIYSIILLSKFYFTDNYKKKISPLVHFSASILIIIGLRSILETSFAIFSIDFLVYIIAFLFLKNHLEKYQKI